MRPHNLPVSPSTFFVVTFILSWTIWALPVLSRFEIGPAIPDGTRSAIGLLGVLMPAVVALVLTARSKSTGVMLSSLRIWRVGWRWWAAAVLVWPALLVLTALVYNWLSADTPIAVEESLTGSAFLTNVVFLLIATLGEEIGWRGLALPVLENRTSALKASVVLGLAWAAWHLPYWLIQDTYTEYGLAYVGLSFLFVLAGTFYITWFFNHGRFSLLLPVAFHVTFNIVNVAWLPVTSNIGAFAILVALNLLVAVGLMNQIQPRRHALGAGQSG